MTNDVLVPVSVPTVDHTIVVRTDLTQLSTPRKPLGFFGRLASLLVFGLAITVTPSLHAGISQSSLDKADAFLRTEERGKQVLNYLHFGADYHGHKYVNTIPLDDTGAFALVYRFWWEDDGVTDLAFLCDQQGFVDRVQVMKTNAVWSQPFSLANLSIKVIGHALVEAYKDKISDDDRRQLHELVNKADAKGLMEFSLKLDQRLQ